MKNLLRGSSDSNYRTASNARDPSSSNSYRQDAGTGVLLTLSGGIALGGLFSLSHFVKLDNLLLVSQAIYNVISGVNGIGLGICQLLLGVAQMVGIAALAVTAVVSVLAVSSGSIRLCLKLLPQLTSTWNFLAQVLNGFVRVLSLPQPQSQPPRTATNSKTRLRSTLHISNTNRASASRAA